MDNFTLSDEAMSILSEISQRHGITSLERCLEFIIRQYRPSDTKRNSLRRRWAWGEYLNSNPSADRSSFFAGYRTGWLHFQTRHNPDTDQTNPSES